MKRKLSLTIPFFLWLCLALSQADSFFVTSSGLNAITKYDENGVGSFFTDTPIHGPSGIALDAHGNFYVATQDNTIEKFSPNGSHLGVFASTGLNSPRGLAFDHAGHLFAANFEGDTVREFAPDGTNLGIFASVTQPTGLAFDGKGNLYVASAARNSIRRFAPDGTLLNNFTSQGLQQPQGLAFDSLGTLYVANYGSGTIESFSPAGADLGQAREKFSQPVPPFLPNEPTRQPVYIAYRTDGRPGNGTPANPFDGSSQAKLDAIFQAFYSAGTTDLAFHLGPGTYTIRGAWDFEWRMLDGWTISGAGETATVMKQVVGTTDDHPGAVFQLIPYTDNQAVEDLTVDCAWFRSGPGGDNSRPHGNFQAIALNGANATVRNVKVTGCGWAVGECFALLTTGNTGHIPDNALLDNVTISDCGPCTGYAMINLAAHGDIPEAKKIYAKNGRIINGDFHVELGQAGGPPGGYDGGLVSNCEFVAGSHGLFLDTFASKNIVISGNDLVALDYGGSGILFNTGKAPVSHLTISNNTIEAGGGVGFASYVTDSVITGNHISTSASGTFQSIFLGEKTVQNITVTNNLIDPNIPYVDRAQSGSFYQANRTSAGAISIPDSANGQADLTRGAFYNGLVGVSGLSGPVGLACDSHDDLHVANSLSATIQNSTADPTDNIVTTTADGPAFIAVQRPPRLANISTRLKVSTGENILAGGFILVGSGAKKVLIRGLGPSLAEAGVDGALSDPVLELHDGATGAIIRANDDWQSNQRTAISATGIPPTNSKESALIATLDPGTYTVIERGQRETTGVGLIEIYDLSSEAGSELANISTRGDVEAGSNVMIAGFIAASATGGSSQVMVRALGPSLGAAGVANPLANPVLELHDCNGTLIASNDNWMSNQKSEIVATGIAPTNDDEAAIIATLAPGTYTAIESGKGGGTGVGLIEVYNLH